MKLTVLGFAVLAFAGCAVQPQTHTMQKSFDEALAKTMLSSGPNAIKGSALVRQNGGGVVTCAGNEVMAIPVTPYSDERMWLLYGSYQRGFRPAGVGGFVIANESPAYRSLMLKTTCDAQGGFRFNNVADGSFYVATQVKWMVGSQPQGGTLMLKVNVWKGEVKEIVLSP